MKEGWRSATPFFQKERCGSGPPFSRAGAGAERRSKNIGALNTLLFGCPISMSNVKMSLILSAYIEQFASACVRRVVKRPD